MSMAVLLIVQAIAAIAAPGALRSAQPAACTGSADEIVVCGRRTEDEQFRLRPLPPRFEPAPLRATTGLGSGTLGIEGEQQSFGNGATSQRLMLKLKLPF